MAIKIVHTDGDPRNRVELYRHLDADGNLLYVGISQDSEVRLRQHARDSHWYDQIETVLIETCRDRAEALKKERDAVVAERPEFNTHLQPRPITSRISKKRRLERAGFVFVAGWVREENAPEIETKIKAAKAKVEEALKDES